MAKQYDLMVRVILIGDTGVGKTCLLCRFVDDQFHANCSATIGIDFKVKNVIVDNKRIRLQIWDTAGQERFETLTKQYYRRAQGVLLVYDISRDGSFRHMGRWLSYVKEFCNNNVEVCVVGNKVDLEEWRQVSMSDGSNFAAQNSFAFYETSSYGEQSLDQVFSELIQRILQKQAKELSKQNVDNAPSDSEAEFNFALREDSVRKSKHSSCCS